MKNIKLFITIIISLTFFVAQSQNLHNAKVMGIIAVGQKDVAIINDLTTGEVFKTPSYNQGLLVSNEEVQLEFPNFGNENKAKIVKANLVKIIFCFKEDHSNSCKDICIKYYGDKMIVIRYVENNFRIIYKARTNGSRINSNVRIFKKKINGVEKVVNTSFFVDTSITSYKLRLHENVIIKANNLKNILSEEAWNNLSTVYENFLVRLNNNNPEVFKTNLGQSTAFHLSIFNTIVRSLNDNVDCGCLPSPYYFTGRTPFMCMKDLKFDKEKMLRTINENQEELKARYDGKTILEVTNYFERQVKSEITFDEMYFSLASITQEEFVENLDITSSFCLFGGGSDIGCCGNYSGCCWYRHTACVIHDLACWTCSHWYCTKWCVSE